MWTRLRNYFMPSWLFFTVRSPLIFIWWIGSKLNLVDFSDKMERLYIINEVRKVTADYGSKDDKGRWNVKVWYKMNKRNITFKVRFRKSAGENIYNKYKTDIQNYTNNTSEYRFKRGCAYFDVVIAYTPIKDVKCDRTSVSVGTGLYGLYMWDFLKYPHALIVGDTGSGKSTFMYYLLNGLLSYGHKIHMVDGKMVDYNTCSYCFDEYVGFNGNNYKEIFDLLNRYKRKMQERQLLMMDRGIKNYMDSDDLHPEFLIIDEYQCLSDFLPKKSKDGYDREQLNQLVRSLVMLGRAMGYIVIVTMQRADSEFISTNTRDNCKFKLVLGKASSTSYDMMFERHDLNGFSVGMGWCMQGNDISTLAIPFCDGLNENILKEAKEKLKQNISADSEAIAR